MKRILILFLFVFSLLNLCAQSKNDLRLEIDRLKTDSLLKSHLIVKQEDRIEYLEHYSSSLLSENERFRRDSAFTANRLEAAAEDRQSLQESRLHLKQINDSLNNRLIEINKFNYSTSFRNSSDIGNFLYYFFSAAYSKKNFDSFIESSSPIFLDLVDEYLGFGRFWNPGIYCALHTSGNFGFTYLKLEPDVSNFKFFKNKSPNGGFCEPATTPDGIYYKEVSSLPQDVDVEHSDYIPVPRKFEYLEKVVVDVVYEKWIISTFYFAKYNGRWFLIYSYDCDCSA